MSKLGWIADSQRTRFNRLVPWILVGGGLAAMIAIILEQAPI
jgi:Na+/melibiose symporter-like transporter